MNIFAVAFAVAAEKQEMVTDEQTLVLLTRFVSEILDQVQDYRERLENIQKYLGYMGADTKHYSCARLRRDHCSTRDACLR
jgi:hypothetical protein